MSTPPKYHSVFVSGEVDNSGRVDLETPRVAGITDALPAATNPVLSADGTKVAYESQANDLGLGKPLFRDIFIRDLKTGTVTHVATNLKGGFANDMTSRAVFSPDSTKIGFTSWASDLTTGGTHTGDAYIEDLKSGAITKVSTNADGVSGDGTSILDDFSSNGSKVLLESLAGNLISDDGNGAEDIFLKDLKTGAVTRVSTSSSGGEANAYSSNGILSSDDSKVAFLSAATNLVSGDTNGKIDGFVKDLKTGALTRVSTDSNGVQANDAITDLVFSADGTKVAFYQPRHQPGCRRHQRQCRHLRQGPDDRCGHPRIDQCQRRSGQWRLARWRVFARRHQDPVRKLGDQSRRFDRRHAADLRQGPGYGHRHPGFDHGGGRYSHRWRRVGQLLGRRHGDCLRQQVEQPVVFGLSGRLHQDAGRHFGR